MRKIYAIIAFISLVSLAAAFIAEKAFAGAWTVPKYKLWGEYYMKWDYAKEVFTVERKRKMLGAEKNARSWEFVMEPKIEYGVTDWLTFLSSIEYKQGNYKEYGRPNDPPLRWGSFARKHHGVTSVKIGGRLRFIEEPVVLSTQTKVFIYPGYGNYHGDDPAYQNQPSIGYGDDAVEQRILIGKKFDIQFTKDFALPCYAGAETGYRWRTRHVCNDIPYFAEAGFWPVSWFLIKTEIDGYKCHAGTGSIKEDYGIWRIGGVWQVFGDSILREGDKMFNLEFQYGMTLWGKNTNAYNEWVLKVQMQF
jgi:hypothetical protein